MRVFVLLFNARTENEGIHTVQIGDRNKVLMFENEDDATRYALLLEAQDFPTATVEEMDSEEIEAFCRSADYDYQIIKAGQLEVPPENNVEATDWSQEQEELVVDETAKNSQMSPEELDSIRRKLEGLL
ncbi:MAG: DUF3110 domain-containing protein [Prochloraceae cyanobacterium]|nr:DUF3110 domain-containing protein [Prochloraceae cyanobacterium]